MKTYTIIIPHRNNFSGITRLIESIYNESKSEDFIAFIKNLTVIIVDDYSDVKIFNKLKELNKEYNFVLLQNTKGRSAGICRNIGLSIANSDYVLFADSDDYFTNNYYKILMKYDENDFDILFFSPTSVLDLDTNVVSDRHIFYINLIKEYKFKNNYEDKLRYMWLGPWSKRFKLDYIKENSILFDETVASNDVMFSVKSGHKAKNIGVTEDIIYTLTRRKGSLIYSYSLDILKARVSVGIRYKNFCDKIGFYGYKDHCLNHLMRGMALGFKNFMKLLYFAKKIGVFKDKKYAFKYIIKGLFSNIIVFFIINRHNILNIDR